MAHYAVLDASNIVIQVFVGKEEDEVVEGVSDWEAYYGAKRTSYNTQGGVHLKGGVPFRKNFAGVGYSYDEQRDAFIPPQRYPSWILNEETCLWEPPLEVPQDGKRYQWVEEELNWKPVD